MIEPELIRAVGILWIVWLSAMGGAAGSFLNVVIYRLPAGISLSHPGSHCPACKHPIRWHHNVPVFGWIWLRGRCRDCGARISPRYPMVEAMTAAIFLVVGLVVGLSGGSNLPIRPEPVAGGWLMLPWSLEQLGGLVLYHLALIVTLLGAAGIEYDGHRVPMRWIVPSMAAGCLASVVWPHLHPVPVWPGAALDPMAGLVDAGAGLVAGLLVGLVAWPVVGTRQGFGFLLAIGCVGLFLGWQAAVAIGLVSLHVHGLARLIGRLARRPVEYPTSWLVAVTLAWILAWQPIVARWSVFG